MGQLFADAARAYLGAGINDTDTTISISSGGALFPVANGTDWFKAVLQDASGIEIVYVTAHTSASTSFTVTRGQEGTTARSFAAGSVFGLRVTAADTAAFAGKVDKVAGKGLSTEDYSTAEKNKLAGVATGATANDTDAALRGRSTHTGTQAISTVTGLQTAMDGKAPLNGTGASGTWPISTTGNAATATKLATARTINGTTFDGSADISVSVGWASVTGKPAVIAAGADAAEARAAIGALGDAPSDGKTYGRKDAAWAEVVAGDSTPAGTVIFYAKNSPPPGYLKANGAVVSRSTYAALFAAIGTTFGVGDGSTTFNVPDLRGQFVRGWVDNGSVDSGRAFGSGQTHAYANHNHTASGSTNTEGAHTHTVPHSGLVGTSVGSGNSLYPDVGVAATTDTSSAGDHSHTLTVTVNNSTTGSTETRPVNVALLACIKF